MNNVKRCSQLNEHEQLSKSIITAGTLTLRQSSSLIECMQAIPLSLFSGLLMVGCAPEVQMIPTLSEEQTKVIDEATNHVDYRIVNREKLAYARDQQLPFTGWAKYVYGNGQIKDLTQYKDGKMDGVEMSWYVPNRKQNRKYVCIVRSLKRWTNNKIMSAIVWKPNGEKCDVTNLKGGNGVIVWYDEKGAEKSRKTFIEGEPING